MTIARFETAPVRRYPSVRARGADLAPSTDAPRRASALPRLLLLGVVMAGAVAQHLLSTLPLEPQPTPLVATVPVSAPAGGSGAVSDGLAPAPAHAVVAPPTAHPTTRAVIARASHAAPVSVHASGGAPVVRAAHPALAPPVTSLAAPKATIVRAMQPLSTTVAPHTSASGLLPPTGAVGDERRVAMAANPQGAILHVPSVSVGAIRDALRAAGSPTLDAHYADGKDVAEYIWDEGRVLGIDPAVLLAIFQHESVFGTQGMARQTMSVGNIRPLPGQPQLDGYRLYHSWQEGIDDCYRLLWSYAHNGATTVSLAIPVWAPPSDDNDDSAYISSVLATMSTLYANSTKAL